MAASPENQDDVFGEDFEDEYYDDFKRAGLRRSPEEGIFGEANSPGSIFTTIFGETVNGEDLAFEFRKHLERSFI